MSIVALIRINANDNVAVATRELARGESVRTADGDEVVTTARVPFAWKVAVREMLPGADIVKYGEKIGTASQRILPGDPVHTHNTVPLPIPDVYIEGT